MAFLKFNKAELVNLSYSLKREILLASKAGAYCNTSIVTCNTRRYHGLLAVTLDRFGGDKYMLLSCLDESLVINGKRFNLGIHRYGTLYEPRGHKYVVDFEADPVPQITYKIGDVVFRKSLIMDCESCQLMIRYELLEAPSAVELRILPYLAFRNVHALTHANDNADSSFKSVEGGVSYCEYAGFPDLYLQFSDKKVAYAHNPYWNYRITYSDEYRRGFDCEEDLLVPGCFTLKMSKGKSLVLSASDKNEDAAGLAAKFTALSRKAPQITSIGDQLRHCADLLITNHNNRKKINAGYSWLYTGLLRETLFALPGLTLFGANDPKSFEEILDNLIADQQERLFRRTTQVEAPLTLASALQVYVEFGASEKAVWKKYGDTVKKIIASYLPGVRAEVTMQPCGLLWAQMDGVALTWMNTYVNGRAVTERPGYQVETNSFWYNSICYAIEMEKQYGTDKQFVDFWEPVRDQIKISFKKTFWYEKGGYLADYVDNWGQNLQVRPNQLFALFVKYSPLQEDLHPLVLKVIDNDLVTARGIRSLSPRDQNYRGVYEGSQMERDLACYQGSNHPVLLGPYVAVSFRIKGPSFWKRAEWLVEGFYSDLSKHGVGAFSELYDGDPPHEPHGAISSAMTTSGLLSVQYQLEKHRGKQV